MPFSASRARALFIASSCAYGPIRTRYIVWPLTSAVSTRASKPISASLAFIDSASDDARNAPACSR